MKRTLILPITALLAGLACGKHEAPQAPPMPAAKVRLAAVDPAGDAGWIAATLTATRRATLSTRMAASVTRVFANEGQHVAEGALLVSLSDGDLQGGLKAAETAVAAAQAHHRRIEALSKINASTPSELEMAATNLAQAQAGLAGVKANLAYTQIRAPFAGIVQSRMVNEGAFVGPGQPLVELEGQGALELEGTVSEQEARSLRIGLKVPFEADGKPGTAEISALSTGGDPVSHRGTIRARILGATGFRSGAFARIKSPGAAPEGLSVPRSALVVRGELSGVFVARDGKAELRWLSLGDARGAAVPVRAGLKAGEQVIDNPGTLVDGQPVEVSK
ncbi:efflux RND transporter periplasmic adaptor subunit [Geothrix sp. 21YS21S-2]|uniref:efflux RND transporter periplasmic adaptor subunit n=1 Tax=Geothrix sp. 21YS21S-2 TaxID=3068893 RepID=UPI0027B977E9|nr:efflux RND transporter periplasmic adaptor subunit [Geothrix sp. 21YS21S-2]